MGTSMTIHADLNLAVAHDDDGVRFKGMTAVKSDVEFAFLTRSLTLLGR